MAGLLGESLAAMRLILGGEEPVKRTRLQGWRVASIRGVDLKIHASLLFLLLYVLLVASAQFPFVLEQSGVDRSALSGSPLSWGLVFAIGLFLSVVIHEFGHVLVAQSLGVRVEGITLMMLGGVSEMERIPETPYAEFKVAIVGPLTSFAIAGALFLVHANAGSAEVGFASYWLARVNVILGVFNLLPAFPMDGGRAFRSLLAARRGMASATQTAVKVAKGFAWALGIMGFLSFNFLLMLIAIFVYAAARSELVIAVSRGLLRGITAGEVSRQVSPIPETWSLRETAEEMVRTRHRIVPLDTRAGNPAIVTADGLRRVPRDRWRSTSAGEAAEKVSRFLKPEDLLDEVLPELAAAGALPVRRNGSIVGVVAYSDITDLLEFKGLAETKDAVGRRAS